MHVEPAHVLDESSLAAPTFGLHGRSALLVANAAEPPPAGFAGYGSGLPAASQPERARL